jgi:predicted component of type VI protein secretion system
VQLVLGKLIKLCDDALVSESEENFIAVNKDNIKELIEQLIDGITVSVKNHYLGS